MDNRHQPKLQDLLTSVKFVSESIGRDFNNNNPFDDGPTSTTHSPKREDEPLTSTQQYNKNYNTHVLGILIVRN